MGSQHGFRGSPHHPAASYNADTGWTQLRINGPKNAECVSNAGICTRNRISLHLETHSRNTLRAQMPQEFMLILISI